jgi:hypothetical protein
VGWVAGWPQARLLQLGLVKSGWAALFIEVGPFNPPFSIKQFFSKYSTFKFGNTKHSLPEVQKFPDLARRKINSKGSIFPAKRSSNSQQNFN